jgi:hypothetical protein
MRAMPCYRCQRVQTDPERGSSPWARGVLRGEQVLICPDCQAGDANWNASLDQCARCGSTRLMVVMGSVVCRQCGFERPAR